MTLTELRYIIAVARVKHFGKAAEECYVSQPTLSVGIRKLEDSLGVSIFERGRSEVKLTPIGESIIKQAKIAMAEVDAIKSIAASNQNQLKDTIKIASTYTIGKYIFPSLVQNAYQSAPELSLQLSQDYHEKLLNKLIKKEVDLVLLSTSITSNQESNKCFLSNCKEYENLLSYQPLLQEDLFLLTAKHNKYSYADSLTIKDLNLADLLLLSNQHCFNKQLLSLNSSWQDMKVTLKESNTDSLESLQDLVLSSSGVAIIPALYANSLNRHQTSKPDIKIIPFDNPKPMRTLSLVWRNDFSRIQAIETIKQSLQGIDIPSLKTCE